MSDASPTPFASRVADRAAEVRFARLLLSLLALPFYVLGFIAGLLVVGARWCWAAVLIGVDDARRRHEPEAVNDAG